MSKFKHKFILSSFSDSSRTYKCGENTVRLDFVSASSLRVAVFRQGEKMLPTFSVNPSGKFLREGRDRLDTQGFELFSPTFTETAGKECFELEGGISVEIDKFNFLLKYKKQGKQLFSDRAPLSYNFEGEFGEGSFHYLTREEGEFIFGLGDKGGDMNKSGRAFRIETTDCMGYNALSSDPLYKHIPFFICENKLGSYGIFYDTSDTSYFDFGKEINNYYSPYKYFKSSDNCLVYYVFFGTKAEILKQFGSLCGKQAFPPKWSFDYCASTMAYTDAPESEKEFEGFLEKLKEYQLPCSGFYLSSGYTSIGDRRYVFNWNNDKFPSPDKFIAKFKNEGIEIIPNIKPAFLDSHPLYGEIAEKGLFVKNPDGTPFLTEFWDGLGSYLDFTNPEAFDYWEEKVKQTLLQKGITTSWNDNNEFDIKDKDALAFGFGSGEVKAERIRPLLTYLMVASSYKAQTKANDRLRPFLSTRSGNIAVRRLAQTWSGDNRTCFEDLRYCHNIGLTMSLSGLHFYGHDVGGFHGPMPSRELLIRWIQHGIFEPRFTIHSWNEDGSATMPWSYPDIMNSVKALFEQRKKLIPYLYNCAYNSVEKEEPINAPLLLYYDDKELYEQNDCLLLGRDILVPFIFDEGKLQTEVYLPRADDWYFNGRLYKGGQMVEVTIPLEGEMPFFIRAGSIIPSGEEKGVFTVFPKESGIMESDFFDDDGVSFKYKAGECIKLHFRAQCDEKEIRLSFKNEGKMPASPEFRLPSGEKRKLILEEE